MKTTTLLICFLAFFSMSSQTVSTYTDGTPDDGIDIDSNGNLYVSDIYGGKIFKFSPTGVMTEFATGLNYPNGLAIDSQDRVYSCEVFHDTSTSNSINRFLPNGTLDMSITVDLNPSGIIKDFDSDDMIFAKYGGNSIHRLSPNGDGTATITTISEAQELNGPVGLAFDDNGELYVGNYENREIYKVLPNGSLEYIATVGNSSNLGFIDFAQGTLWGTVLGEHKIYRINPNGINDVTLFAGSVGGTMDGDISVATFAAPNGIKFNGVGDTMYISEFNSKNIRIISGISLSLEEFQSNDIKLITPFYKNEVVLIAKVQNSNKLQLTIRQLHGQTVLRETLNTINSSVVKKIRTDSWDNGIYLMTIHAGKKMSTKKFIINN